jgi:hypothetical protein
MAGTQNIALDASKGLVTFFHLAESGTPERS